MVTREEHQALVSSIKEHERRITDLESSHLAITDHIADTKAALAAIDVDLQNIHRTLEKMK
jgi:septal ring factor EnvC (AmiA/AmiB activator)